MEKQELGQQILTELTETGKLPSSPEAYIGLMVALNNNLSTFAKSNSYQTSVSRQITDIIDNALCLAGKEVSVG